MVTTERHHLFALPVVDNDDKLVGILTVHHIPITTVDKQLVGMVWSIESEPRSQL